MPLSYIFSCNRAFQLSNVIVIPIRWWQALRPSNSIVIQICLQRSTSPAQCYCDIHLSNEKHFASPMLQTALRSPSLYCHINLPADNQPVQCEHLACASQYMYPVICPLAYVLLSVCLFSLLACRSEGQPLSWGWICVYIEDYQATAACFWYSILQPQGNCDGVTNFKG